MSPESAIVQKLWNYCNVLRDDGVSYGDYVEQLTFLLFLKMIDEQKKLPERLRPAKVFEIPREYSWPQLVKLDGEELELHYRHTLDALGKQGGLLGTIFAKAQNRIQDPAKLKRLVSLIDDETWMGMDIDIKGSIYEGLLEKNAEDIKSGAGQYFTPRALIRAMVEVIAPKPGERIADPACGTGGFFLVAHEHLLKHSKLDRKQLEFLRDETFRGIELVPETARLCAMNMYLHGIGESEALVESGRDSLSAPPDRQFEVVLTNPPFGKKSSITVVGEDGSADRESITYERDDFWVTTSNKQLNFLQHVRTMLEVHGRCGIVLPDNVLFEGGAGETVRRKLLATCEVHTLLRLPTGIFYRPGVKANVLFFDRKPAREKPWTEELWIYDFRTNMHFTLKTDPLKAEDLSDFIKCYNPANRHQRKESERFRRFTCDELMARDKVSLDIFWLKDDSLQDAENLPDPDVIAADIVENLQSALEQFESIQDELREE